MELGSRVAVEYNETNRKLTIHFSHAANFMKNKWSSFAGGQNVLNNAKVLFSSHKIFTMDFRQLGTSY